MDAESSEAKRRNRLPDLDSLDIASLKALVLAKHTEIENLKLLVLKLKRMHFGQRSEKMNADIGQLELQLEDLETNQAAAEPLPAQLAIFAVNAKAAKKPARRPLPAELPRETETIAPKQASCPDCGGTLRPLGEDVPEVLEYVPARFKVIRTVRPKLSCACCSRIVQEPAPHRPIDKGLAGPGLLAHVLVAKYADHLPLYRQSEIYAREGVALDRSTLADWVGGASRTLRPLVEALKSYVLSAEKLHGDEVPVPVLEPGNGKTKILNQRVPVLHRMIHTGAYRAKPSRRVFIPKADGRQRALGIASIEDKIVQQAVVTVLSEIYEGDFLGFSYGFRLGRGQHNALDALTVGIKSQKVNWILDADIRSFFDEIDHGWMLRFLEHRIADQRVLSLIRKWLEAGVIENGCRIPSTKGTPQGAVISPLLANIYLHYAFDQWVQHWRKQPGRGAVVVIRYADDSVMGFEKEQTARAFLADVRERFAKFGLALHPDKTRLIQFGRFASDRRRRKGEGRPETFDFPGFTHCCGTDRKGKFQIVRLTAKKRMRATMTAIRDALYRKRHEPVPAVGAWLKRVINGYFEYHAVPTNLMRLEGFRAEVCRAWRHALLRRSQRHRLCWERFNRLTRKYVPPCRVRHPYPEERFLASRP